MTTTYELMDGACANDLYHGDENLCDNEDCMGDPEIWCTCKEDYLLRFERQLEDEAMWID